jgi:hypothetical protein
VTLRARQAAGKGIASAAKNEDAQKKVAGGLKKGLFGGGD